MAFLKRVVIVIKENFQFMWEFFLFIVPNRDKRKIYNYDNLFYTFM